MVDRTLVQSERRGSLQRQLILSINISLFVVTLAAFIYDYTTQRHILKTNFHDYMLEQVQHIAITLDQTSSFSDAFNTLNEFCRFMKGHNDPGHEITLIDDKGEILLSSKTYQKKR